MPSRLETPVLDLVHQLYGGAVIKETPDWLQRPGQAECRRRWGLIQAIYRDLTGHQLPGTMPPRESRTLDAILQKRGQPPRIVEYDGDQHLNVYRAQTLHLYPRSVRLAFPKRLWIERSEQGIKAGGVGFAASKPPLFPGDGGRHRQRAFRDALADILPLTYGWHPTLRIGEFEVKHWIDEQNAKAEMRQLLKARL